MHKKHERHSTTDIVDAEHEGEDIYKALEITRNASAEEVKKAYRRMALKHHPDKISVHCSKEERAVATKRFQQLSLYYAILSDDVKRARYDRTYQQILAYNCHIQQLTFFKVREALKTQAAASWTT
jgi:DnaJ-class molecular chaperone